MRRPTTTRPEGASTRPASSPPMDEPEPKAQRHVTLRDARLEGEPDVEPDAQTPEQPMKDAQRDLTSLSGPVRRRT